MASHINVPKDNWTKYHEPFKDICKENEIVDNDCNIHDPISENNVLYKHVNFCGVHRPCESTQVEEDNYCKQHKHEKTSIWSNDLNEFAKKVQDNYPSICELCSEVGHFNFQCLDFCDKIINPLCDEMTTSVL